MEWLGSTICFERQQLVLMERPMLVIRVRVQRMWAFFVRLIPDLNSHDIRDVLNTLL